MVATHGNRLILDEIQAYFSDINDEFIVSGGLPALPVSSLTLAPFQTATYVKDLGKLTYVSQDAEAVTVTDSGTVWIGIHKDTTGAVAGFTRVPNSHYITAVSTTKPDNPPGGVVFTRVTTSAGAITSVANFAFRSAIDAYYRHQNPISWGAVANGVADDTTACQNALDALIFQGGMLFLPGTEFGPTFERFFTITASLNLPPTHGIIVKGEGRRRSFISQRTLGEDVFRCPSASVNDVEFLDLYINGNAAANYGIVLGNVAGNANRSKITNCRFDGFEQAGIGLNNSNVISIHECAFGGRQNGISIIDDTSTQPNAVSVTNCNFEVNTGYGLFLQSAINGWNISGCMFQSNRTGAIYIGSGNGVNITGNYFESNFDAAGAARYTDIFLGDISALRGVNIRGNYFSGKHFVTTQNYTPIRVGVVEAVEIGKNVINNGTRFFEVETDTQSVINLNIERQAFSVEGNPDLTGGAEGTFRNLPANFFNMDRNNSIEQFKVFLPRQDLIKTGSVRLALNMVTPVVAGSGSVTRSGHGIFLDTGTTAGSSAFARTSPGPNFGIAGFNGNYSSQQEWCFVVDIASVAANGQFWFMISGNTGAGEAATRSIGFRVDQLALFGITHDGTTLNAVNLSTNLVATTQCLSFFRRAGDVIFYVNGVQVGSTNLNVPTGTAAMNVTFSTLNNSDAALNRYSVYDTYYAVTQ